MSDPLPVVEEDEYHRIIERNRHKIVKMINVNVFLDPLRTKGILSGDDAEEIQNSPIHITRKSKAGFFLDILQTKGDRGLEVFLEILEYELPQLFEEVTSKTAREPPQDYIKHRESVVMNWVYRLPEFAKDLQRDYDHNKDLRKKLKDMEEILKYAQDNNSFLEQENEELRKKLDRILIEKNSTEERLAECYREINNLKDQSLKHLTECLELQKESQTCRERLRDVMLEKDEMERQNHALRNDLSKNHADLMIAKRQSIVLPRQPPIVTSPNIDRQLSETEIRIKILEEKLDDEYKNREDLSLRLQQATNEADDYQNRYRKMRESHEKVTKERNALMNSLEEREKRINDYYRMIIDLQNQKSRVEEERNNEQKKLAEMSEEKFKQFIDHHRVVDELEVLKSKYEQLKIQYNRHSGESDKGKDEYELQCDSESRDQFQISSDNLDGNFKSSTLPATFSSGISHLSDTNEFSRVSAFERRYCRKPKPQEVYDNFSDVPHSSLDRSATLQPERGSDIFYVDDKPQRLDTKVFQAAAKLELRTDPSTHEFGIQETDSPSELRPRGPRNYNATPPDHVSNSDQVTISSEESDDVMHNAEYTYILSEFIPHKPRLPPPKLTGLSGNPIKEQTFKINLPMRLELTGGNVIGIYVQKSSESRLNPGDEILSVSLINESNYQIISTQCLKHCTLEEALSAFDLNSTPGSSQIEVKVRKVSAAESEAIRVWKEKHKSNGDYFFIRFNISHESPAVNSDVLSIKRGDVMKVTNTNIQKGHWQVTLWDHIKGKWTKEGIIPKDMRKFKVPTTQVNATKKKAFRIRFAAFERVLPTKVQTKLPVILHGNKDIVRRLQEMMVDASSDYCICNSEEACKKISETMKMCQQRDKHVLLNELFLKRRSQLWVAYIVVCLNTERASPSAIHKIFGEDIHQSMDIYKELPREDIVYETITLPHPEIADKRENLLKLVFEAVKRGQERVYWSSDSQLDSATVDSYKQFLSDDSINRMTGDDKRYRRSLSLPNNCLQ